MLPRGYDREIMLTAAEMVMGRATTVYQGYDGVDFGTSVRFVSKRKIHVHVFTFISRPPHLPYAPWAAHDERLEAAGADAGWCHSCGRKRTDFSVSNFWSVLAIVFHRR